MDIERPSSRSSGLVNWGWTLLVLGGWAFALLFQFSLICAIIWVAWHFISKYW